MKTFKSNNLFFNNDFFKDNNYNKGFIFFSFHEGKNII